MSRIFNMAGPCVPERHYMLPALARLPEAKRLIEDCAYYLQHTAETGQAWWLVVFDSDLAKPWEDKIGLDEIAWRNKRVHVVRC